VHRLLNALVTVLSFAGLMSGISVAPAIGQDSPQPRESEAAVHGQGAQPVVLPPGVTRENVDVKDRPLIIEGSVKGSVHAVNSHVTLMPGASIDGDLTLIGSSLSVSPQAGLASIAQTHAPAAAPKLPRRADWFGGQLCLWLLGLAGGLVVLVAAPHATARVDDTIIARPGRSLLIGLAVAFAIFSALSVSGMIMNTHSIFSVLWTPVTVALTIVTVCLLMFGWLTGMRRVGDLLARRCGYVGNGTFFGRMALGLTAFFVANAIAGAIAPGLGAVGLAVEFGIAVMGAGAVVQTAYSRRAEPLLGHRFGGFS